MQRVEELADRPEGFKPERAIPYRNLLPLYEIISFAKGVNRLYSKPVIEEQDRLTRFFGNELNVLLEVSKEDLLRLTSEKVANTIIAARENNIRLKPGYDGVYGYPFQPE